VGAKKTIDWLKPVSRIESIASSGDVMVSESTAKLIKETFDLTPGRIVDLKGKGPTLVFSVKRGGQASQTISQNQPVLAPISPRIEQSNRVTETNPSTQE
jgi:hypothetical protein